MTKATAQRICQRINDAEVALPGVWCAHLARYRSGCYGVHLIGRRAQSLAIVTQVAHYQALAQGQHVPVPTYAGPDGRRYTIPEEERR
jgi:hypothetical protein